MQSTKTKKHDVYARLSCRVSSRIKSEAEEAANLLGQSMTDFTESALAEKAKAVFDNQQRILLSERDFAYFITLIENPPPPTQKLKDAMAAYLRLKSEFPESNL